VSRNTGPKLPAHIDVELRLDDPDDDVSLRTRVARKLRCDEQSLPPLRLLRRGIDARGGRVRIALQFAFDVEQAPIGKPRLPQEVRSPLNILVVGHGPAGLFCPYALARAGVACTVIDRGKPVQPRRLDLAKLNKQGIVHPDSNYCFGEGGAGTYSDGKLYCRATKRGDIRDVLEILALHGAPARILTDARPHIGSNKLPKVLLAMRARLEAVGVQFRFESVVSKLLVQATHARKKIQGVRLTNTEELAADALVLCTGHSARDIFYELQNAGVCLEAKPFAVGARVEHPQALINRIQYKRSAGHPKLPNASYRLATTVKARGVFSFCMCPGGWIVPATTAEGELVVNGMSLSRRDSPYANSGLVVGIEPQDLIDVGYKGALAGVEFQACLERAAYAAGGGAQRAPATRLTDFVANTASVDVSRSSYLPGLFATELGEVLDSGGLPIAAKLRAAIKNFGAMMPGYLSDEATLVGVESRTSSPVRIPRDETTFQSPDIAGLYPVGEGAGYAGGIISAAIDGINAAQRILQTLT